MSLIGNLEDLGLGDILQIINLSQKSGVLSIRGEGGEGRIVFQEGMVRYAGLDGGPTDLHDLLVKSGFIGEEDFAAARSRADEGGTSLDTALATCAGLDVERIESLRREAAETAVAEMFSWRAGDFSFDVGDDERWVSSDLALSSGVNAQYLAMESMRVKDEDDREEGEEAAEQAGDAPESGLNLDLSAEEMFGVVDDSQGAQGDDEAGALASSADPFAEEDLDDGAIDETGLDDGDTGLDDALESAEKEADVIEGALLLEEVEAEPTVETEPFLELDDFSAEAPEEITEPQHEAPAALLLESSDVAGDAEPMLELDDASDAPILEASSIAEVEPIDEAATHEAIEPLAELEPAIEPPAVQLDAMAEPASGATEEAESLVASDLLVEPESVEVEASIAASESVVDDAPNASERMPSDDLPPVVVIAPSLVLLEWVRDALASEFGQVHIFQRSQEGLGRIRQYLARARTPLLLVSPSIDGNPLSGISDSGDFVARLKRQAPRMPIHWLTEAATADHLDAGLPKLPMVLCPNVKDLGGEDEASFAEAEARLCETLLSSLGELDSNEAQRGASEKSAEAPRQESLNDVSSEGLDRLRTATQALSDASSRGEVLPLVMSFASEFFSRVAMFMVRGDSVIGMAQRGLEEGGGPDDIEMRAMTLAREEVSWFREVVRSRCALRRGVEEDGDRRLVSLLGGRTPDEVYVAPIVSADQVVALLYADNVSSAPRSGETSALEVVLHHAGLALDRAMLERTLAQIEDESK